MTAKSSGGERRKLKCICGIYLPRMCRADILKRKQIAKDYKWFDIPALRELANFFVLRCMWTNVKRTFQFKTWCKGDESNIKTNTDHFCEDTRQNALAALANLGHVTTFLLLGPPHHLTIQRVREITSLDSKLPDQTEVHIRNVLSSDPLAERNSPHSSRTLFAQRRRWRCCWITFEYDKFPEKQAQFS